MIRNAASDQQFMPVYLPKKRCAFIIRLVLSCLILLYLARYIDFARVKLMLREMQVRYAWQAFFLLLATNLVTAVRWSFLLKHFRIRQRIRDSWTYYMIGGFYSIALPGVIGGDVVRLYLSSKKNARSKTIVATSILFERSCGIMVILILASSAALFMPMLLEGKTVVVNSIRGAALAAIFLFFLFFIIIKNSSRQWFKAVDMPDAWQHQANTLIENFRRLSFGSVAFFLSLSVGAHFLDILGSFYLGKSLNIDLPLSVFLLIMPLVYVSTILPISIGGIGVREGVLTFFLAKVGVLASDAVLLALVIYMNRVLVGFIGGILQFIEKRSPSMDKV